MMVNKTWMLFVGMLTFLVTCSIANANGIRLHDQISVEGPTVELDEIAEISGDYAKQFAKITVASFKDSAEITVKMDDIRQLLSDEKANWGLLSLTGFRQTQVRMSRPVPVVIHGESTEPVISNTIVPVDMEQRVSLRAMVETHLSKRLGVDLSDLRITFSKRDTEQLSRVAVGKKFEILPQGRSLLGRVPIVVRRYENARAVEEMRVYASISMRIEGLVLQRSIRSGEVITSDAVRLEEKWITKRTEQPIQSTRHTTGQIAKRALREGALLYPHDIQLPAIIKRGQLVTVTAVAGSVVVTTTAKAIENGSLNDLISVRHLNTNEVFTIQVTGRAKGTTAFDHAQISNASATGTSFAHRGINR